MPWKDVVQTQPAPIQQRRHQANRTLQLPHQKRDFIPRQHHRQPGPPRRPHHPREPGQLHAQHITIEKQYRAQRLRLG